MTEQQSNSVKHGSNLTSFNETQNSTELREICATAGEWVGDGRGGGRLASHVVSIPIRRDKSRKIETIVLK